MAQLMVVRALVGADGHHYKTNWQEEHHDV